MPAKITCITNFNILPQSLLLVSFTSGSLVLALNHSLYVIFHSFPCTSQNYFSEEHVLLISNKLTITNILLHYGVDHKFSSTIPTMHDLQ